MTAYAEALAELTAAERLAARMKTQEAIDRVMVARAKATALYRREDAGAAPESRPRVGIGNRSPS